MEQNFYAVFFNAVGETAFTQSGQFNMEPLGMFENQASAIKHAQTLFPSNHVRGGVCMLKNNGKGLGGFTVMNYCDLQDLWSQQGEAA